MKKVKPPLVLALITAAALVFIYKDKIKDKFWPDQKKEIAESGAPSRGPGMGGHKRRKDPNRVVPILAEPATTANIPVYLQGVGTVQASNTATVRAQVSGRLIAVNYREGQEVKKGDVLAMIDPVTYKAAYDQAVAKKAMNEAQLANARLDLKRYEGLAKGDYGTHQQADTQRATVAQLEAQTRQDQAAIDSAKANLDYTTIVAPIDGRTGIRAVDIGNLVTSNDTNGIVVITQVKPISVLFTLPEIHVGDLVEAHAHGKVDLEARVGGEVVGTGVLEVIDNRIDQTTGTVRLKGTFANESQRLWPGQFVNIQLHLKTLENATVVPAVAVQQGANGRFVYVLQPNGTVKLTTVKVTQEDENLAVIASGLASGEKVATVGFGDLSDGAKISLDDGKSREGGKGKRKGGAGKDGPPESEKPSGAAAASMPEKVETESSKGDAQGTANASAPVQQANLPTIQVTTRLPGASADTVAQIITAPLERRLREIQALDAMSSTSSQGLSQITLQFQLNRDIYAAALDVQSTIIATNNSLPTELPNPPLMEKVNPSEPPNFTIILTSDSQTPAILNNLASTVLIPRLSQVTGVGRVSERGDTRPVIRVEFDMQRLADFGLDLEKVRAFIAASNTSGLKAMLEGTQKAFTIDASDASSSAKDYGDEVISLVNGAQVRLGDVATMVSDVRNVTHYNGVPAVIIDVRSVPGADIVNMVDNLKRLLPALKKEFPSGVSAEVTIGGKRWP